jgi:hypothetical protein
VDEAQAEKVPTLVTEERRAEFERVVTSTITWAIGRTDIRAVGLVGSWAREHTRMGSDADFTVLTNDIDAYVTNAAWVEDVAGSRARLIRTRQWGFLTERRVMLLPSGFEVEYGFAPPSWADPAPLDEGTAGVVADGMQILHDRDGCLEDWPQPSQRDAFPEHRRDLTIV